MFKKISEFIRAQFIIPLLAIVVFGPIIAFAAGWFTGPSSYRIYFVGDWNDLIVRNSWSEIQSSLSGEQIDDVKVELVKIDAAPAEADNVSKMIVGQNDTIFVIGHFSSTASARALYNYMLADPPVPVILPVESNPDLGIRDSSRSYSPIFRLVPADDLQAEKAANFAEETGAKHIWVIEDTRTNPVYAEYVSGRFIKLIQDKYDEKSYLSKCEESMSTYDCKTAKKWASENFHARVVLRTEVLNPPSLDIINPLDIDLVFFVGHEENCMLTANQLNEVFKRLKARPILLTAKGCENYLTKGASVITEQAYMTHHVAASQFYSLEYLGRPGKEAGQILKQILVGVRQSRTLLSGISNMGFLDSVRLILKWHRAPDVRIALASEMEKSVEKTPFTIEGGAAGRYDLRFTKNGRVLGKNFHVWRLKNTDQGKRFEDWQKDSDGQSLSELQ